MKGDNVTIDELQNYGLRIIQPRHGYRFSLDPLLLCDFSECAVGGRVVDLGAGCGVIPLVLARKDEAARIVGVEFQHEMAELATRNVLLNGLAGRIEIVEADIISLRKLFPVSSFDLVVANPPYRKPGSGKISPGAGRDRARHESTAGLAEFLMAAKYLVKPAGSICLIYHTSRLADCLAESERQRLAPVRLRFVHGSPEAEARMFLVELVKGRKGELTVLPPCFVAARDGDGVVAPNSKEGETE